MIEKEIDLGERKITIREMAYLDFVSKPLSEDKRERQLQIFELHGVNREIAEKLTYKEGNVLAKEINILDGFGQDFPISPNTNNA